MVKMLIEADRFLRPEPPALEGKRDTLVLWRSHGMLSASKIQKRT
jgi:hypothetical protein